MPYKTIKPDRDKKFQPGVYGEAFDDEDLTFDNIDDAVAYLKCTKEDLIKAIQENNDGTDISTLSGQAAFEKGNLGGYYWSYIEKE